MISFMWKLFSIVMLLLVTSSVIFTYRADDIVGFVTMLLSLFFWCIMFGFSDKFVGYISNRR